MDDGFQYFWVKDRGALSASDLRVIAEELDRRNKDWQEQIDRDLCRQNGGVMVQPWRQGDVIAEWRPLEKFAARSGSIVLRRWKTREAGDWKYGLIEDWRDVAVGGWQYEETSEFLLIESSRERLSSSGCRGKPMSTKSASSAAPLQRPCYAVGDRVRMRRTLTEAASDELPAQHLCNSGEVLIVRKVTEEKRPRNGIWPVYVSHEHITDRSFGVMLDEIEAA